MDLNFLSDFMSPMILGICLCVGYILKNLISTERIDKYIPTIVAVIGMILSIWINEWSITPQSILSGLMSGLASTGMHQLFKQYIESKDKLN